MNSEFTWSNVIVKRRSISIRSYKIISFSDLPFSKVFPLNKPDLSIFARNVLKGFHCSPSALKFKSVPFVQKKSYCTQIPEITLQKQHYMKIQQYSLRCWVLTEVIMKTAVFWDVALPILEEVY